MHTLLNFGGFSNCLFVSRAMSFATTMSNNYYAVLGLTPSATQNEIKSAYFQLCKKYHPDKNMGSVDSANMFRKISEAYEVLGNENLREVYDRRMGYHSFMPNAQRKNMERPEAADEAHRKQKFRRVYTGRTPFYNYDDWFNAHYGHSRNVNHEQWLRNRTMPEQGNIRGRRRIGFMYLIASLFLFVTFCLDEELTVQPFYRAAPRYNPNGETKNHQLNNHETNNK